MKTNQNALGANQVFQEKGAVMTATKTVSMVYAKLMELVLMVAIIQSMVLDVPKIVVLIVCIVTTNMAVKNVYLDSTGQLVKENVMINVSIVLFTFVKSVNLVFMEACVMVIVLHNVLPVTQKISALPVGTAGPDVYANVAKTAKTKIAMMMESVKASVKTPIIGNVVMFPVLLRIV